MFEIEKKYKRSLHRRAYSQQQKGHHEVCGVVVLNGNKIELEYCDNVSNQPMSFAIEETEIDRIKRKCYRQGKKFGGIFHSHPISDGTPSVKDVNGASLNKIMMIYDVCGRAADLWKVGIKKGKRTLEHLQNINGGFHQ